jgi:hypothetical protein
MKRQVKAQAASTTLMAATAVASHISQPVAALLLFTFPLTAGFFLLSWKPKLLAKLLGKF